MFFLYSHLIHHNKSQIKLLNQYFPSLTQKKPLKNSHKKRPKSGFLFSLDHPYKKMYSYNVYSVVYFISYGVYALH